MSAVIVHPGFILNEELLSLTLDVSIASKMSGISEDDLNGILRGASDFTPEIANAVGKLTSTEAGYWLALQAAFDMASSKARTSARQNFPYPQ